MNTRQRIMVVDNNQDMQQLLDITLTRDGFDTVIVADGDTALTLLAKVEPDLVILDSMAPEDEDFQELDRIREHSDVPIVMLAANYEMESLRRAFSLGADDYIRKPFERRAFLARIRAKMRRAREYTRSPTPVMT